MKRILLLILVVVLAVGGYLYYRTVTTGPKFALAKAAKAVHDHDVASFEKYVDVESVAGSLVDQVAEQDQVLSLISANTSGMMMRGALNLAKPQLAKAARKEVQHFVETGSFDANANNEFERVVKFSLAGLASRVVSPESSFKGVKYLKEQGEQALVGLEFTQPKLDTTLVLELQMRNRGDYWQVTEITNLGEVLRQTARLEKQRLFGPVQ
ncbi:DUF2939 domain-containing protein [Solirubrum puertoriconensis]|uniref:DUF2939 domain-containing protein n=1 Tax=Solirubrum puertoriconensis TaxID=1751427 RepID=A0A9X0HHI6_SOLP1|nr:DUF2939 domain-containing protein [Solirubrum puertoriconensis]KUG05981.1 hypothetical protein ASU33_00975 [Solirubrum puertoriconensis]